MALDNKGFDPSTLVYWRKRLAKSERPHRINDAVGAAVAETGVLGPTWNGSSPRSPTEPAVASNCACCVFLALR